MEAENPEQKPETGSALLPLDAERVVSFMDRGFPYIYRFPRIQAREWEKCFNAIVVTSARDGDGLVNAADTDTPIAEMVLSLVATVEGYRGSFLEKPNWKQFLPYGHVKRVGELLQAAEARIDGDGPIDPEGIAICLRAPWGSVKPGTMTFYDGLIHHFNNPTAEQVRRYNRVMAEVRVVGGSRAGTTIYSPPQGFLMKLYDELIQGIEGYSIGGNSLTVEQARGEMDACHKVVAMRKLMAAPEEMQTGTSER